MSRLLAARLLERTLLRVGRAGTLVDRRLAPALQRLSSRRLHRLLGYVRLGDYLTERLGMSLRRCQAILRLDRILVPLPGLGRALEAGEVSLSKVEVIAGIATAATEASWLERARRLTVAGLRDAARAARAGEDAAGDTVATPLQPAAGAPATEAASIEQDEPGRIVSFVAPASVVGLWHWTLDLVRRVAGQQEPAWRCAEYLAAEFLSGVPDIAGGGPDHATGPVPAGGSTAASPIPSAPAGARDLDPPLDSTTAARDPGPPLDSTTGARDPAPPLDSTTGARDPALAPDAASDASGPAAWSEACDAVREALASIGAAAGIDAILSEPPVGGGEDEPDAWDLDLLLRRLVRLRQSLAWRQGRLLAAFASLRLHRALGFASLDDWIVDRLPMSPRRARYLMSLDRRLRDLPLVADAYRRGLVSWCQVRLLVRVVAPATQSRWIRYARQVTVRRLEDAIVACDIDSTRDIDRSLESERPAHIGASPLPPAEPSPAGSDNALHTSAPDRLGRVAAGDLLHTSAPDRLGRVAAGDLLHTSAPDRPACVAASDLLHTSAPHPCGRQSGPAASGREVVRRIFFWAPLDVAAVWDSALRACRAASGTRLDDWECLLLFVQALRDTWDNPDDPQWKRRYRIFERDGWRCMAPGCTSRSRLNEHHIVFRSQQGNDDEDNLVTLCIGHHQEGVHDGRLGCFGRAPDSLWWDLGVRAGREPLVRYFGDRIVTRRPRLPLPARAGAGAAVDLNQRLSHNLPFAAGGRR